MTVDHQDWMERPLSSEYLDYAARDARLIHVLFDTFTIAEWTKLLSLEESMRYVTFHKYSQPNDEDQYKSHSLLPLGILDPPLRKCVGCERQLPFDSFIETDSGGQCYVCMAIMKRMKDEPRPRAWDPRRKGNRKGEPAIEAEPPGSPGAKEGNRMSSDGEFRVNHRVVTSY